MQRFIPEPAVHDVVWSIANLRKDDFTRKGHILLPPLTSGFGTQFLAGEKTFHSPLLSEEGSHEKRRWLFEEPTQSQISTSILKYTTKSQGKNLTLTVLYVPYSLDSGCIIQKCVLYQTGLYMKFQGGLYMKVGQSGYHDTHVKYLLCFFFFTLVIGPRRSLSLKLSDTKSL